MRSNRKVGRRLKLGILVSHPIQYFVPVYRELAKRDDIDLTVIYRTRVGVDEYYDPGFGKTISWDLPLLEGYRSVFLSEKTNLRGLEPSVAIMLWRYRFDVLVVHGYNYATNLLGVAVAKLAGTKVLLRGDTRLQNKHLISPLYKRWGKRRLLALFDGFLAIGRLNHDYYQAHGIKEEFITFAPFCVDNSVFSLSASEASGRRGVVRCEFGIPEDAIVVLYASKLTKRKRAHDLVTAFALAAEECSRAWLVIAGDGEQASNLKGLVRDSGIERIRFVGFLNQSALPGLYAAADFFVLPSEEEPWGLIVNEVMAAGLPVIVSDQVGAAADLVEGRSTGIVYPCGDIGALRSALESLLKSPELRKTMGTNARKLIRSWDVDACATEFVAATRAQVALAPTTLTK